MHQRRILGVHGIRNYHGDDVHRVQRLLADRWSAALGLPASSQSKNAATVSIAYYAHLLAPARGTQGVRSISDVGPEAQKLALEWVTATFPEIPDALRQGRATQPLRAMLSWIASSRAVPDTPFQAMVARFFDELHRYLASPHGERERISDLVVDEIRKNRPDVVVGHSLGTVVAYEALFRTDVGVPTFVTLGSPLGMPRIIFPKLQPAPADGAGRRPPVSKWVNVADRGDVIAIPPSLRTLFPGIDYAIELTIHPFGFHAVERYLATPQVRNIIVDTTVRS